MTYNFSFELNENNVVKYEITKDGNRYVSSTKEMYPDDKLIKEVGNYYSEKKIIVMVNILK